MKIVVCVKQIPDPNLGMHVDPQTKRLRRDPAQSILDPSDEYGLETALRLVEQHGGEVVALSMGPESAQDALRRAMAMGADRAILLTDPLLAGSDVPATVKALAAAIAPEQPDLIICATESTDAYSGMVPGALAAVLDLPQLTFARSVEVEGSTITVQRDTESGYQVAQATLPALMTVTASIAEPRYPSFKGMMAAKRKPIDERGIGALGLDQSSVGEAGAHEQVLALEQVHKEKQGRKIVDEGGESAAEIVAFLKQIGVV
ncbi:MAG TPA: electron transfer flavoprotein subunit beta/FixA family protein [Thermomicrobiaceae bacterium]|nr:electron transfer flavoprotein subunit beta/FixA family protein [Thermomicrobiaceae bacterium]